MAGFSAEFLAGLTAPDRSRFLGDVDDSDPRYWAWGRPAGPPPDGLVLLYAARPDILERRQAELLRRLAGAGISGVTELDTIELTSQEPFGFRDGISQPVIAGLPKAAGAGRTVPAGEFVLGYPNARGQLTDRPLLPSSDDPGRLLLPDPAGSGQVDLGRNGTYLVLRQLEQDVDGFWRYLGQVTRRPDGTEDPAGRVTLAAKMVGRWPSGAPLAEAPGRDVPALSLDNDFGYHSDPLGLACPIGAHIRRANPRDSLDAQPAASLDASDLHRLLRRGRSYGPAAGRGSAGHGPGGDGAWPDRAVLHLPGGQPVQAVRVRAAHLAEQPEFRRPVRRRGSAHRRPSPGRRDLHRSGPPGPPPVPRPAPVRADPRRGLLLHARHLGHALSGPAAGIRASPACGEVAVHRVAIPVTAAGRTGAAASCISGGQADSVLAGTSREGTCQTSAPRTRRP